MTKTIDKIWVAQGIKEAELVAVKGRGIIYAALIAMSCVSGALVVGIVSNLVG